MHCYTPNLFRNLYTYMCVLVYVCKRECVCVYACMLVFGYMFIFASLLVCVRMFLRVCVSPIVYVFICVCVCVFELHCMRVCFCALILVSASLHACKYEHCILCVRVLYSLTYCLILALIVCLYSPASSTFAHLFSADLACSHLQNEDAKLSRILEDER